MFDHLVTPSGTKIAHGAGDLAEYARRSERRGHAACSTQLGRERILRAVDGAGASATRYEIFHDVLADGVLAWRARRVIERDREEAQRRQRRLVAVAVAALVALGAMTAVAVYALTERSHARSAARLARAHALEARSLFEQATNPTRALADAVAAAQSDPGARAEGVLRQALVANHERRVLRAPGSVSVVAFAPTGGRMLAGDAGGGLRVYSKNGRLERTLAVAGPVTAASFSPNGALVLGAAGREAMLWRAATGERLQTLAPARRRDLRVVQPRRPRPAHDHRAGRDGLAHGYRPSRCRAREAGCDERRLLARRPPGRDARCGKARSPPRSHLRRRTGRLLHVLAPRIGEAGRARGRRVLFGQPPPGDDELPGHVPLERPQRPAVRSAPLRQARRGDRRGLQPGRQPARRRGTGRRRSDLGRGEGRSSLLLSGSQQSGHRSRVEPGRALLGGWRAPTGPCTCCRPTAPWEAAWWAISPATVQLCGQSPGARTDARCSAGAPTARRGSGTPSSTRSCSPWEGRHRGAAVEASFDPAGRRIVSAGSDGTARIWSVRGRRLLHALSHRRAVEDAEFSSDGRLVVTASSDGTAGIWSSTTGARLRTLQEGAPVSSPGSARMGRSS